MKMSYSPFPSRIPQFCRDAARLFYVCEKHANHHKKKRKLALTGICHKIDELVDEACYNRDHLDRCIEEGSVVGVLYFKKCLDENKKSIDGYVKLLPSGPLSKQTKQNISDNDITRAREFPIDQLIEFNRAGFARCIWHQEKTPSMHLKGNHVYCFSCQHHGDAIEVYMQIHGVDFKNAVRHLS